MTVYYLGAPTDQEVEAARNRLAHYLYSISAENHLAWDELHDNTRNRWRQRATTAMGVLAGEDSDYDYN